MSAPPGDSDSLRDEKRVVPSQPKYQAIFIISTLPKRNSALTIANGFNLNEIASKFLKFCRVTSSGMVTWGKI
ncbi:hypothetical protein [Bradyrhizobium sp. UNPA324]|uniref:hypothetical protein n=1 Tax=Bradyrhizobium sp. UNPA324 TaxID=1141174 RepID=UPI00114DC36C|nr:hypothetical protein [Bradyrhizobium sp. UNPA324]